MAEFIDADGRKWPVEISVATLKRMRVEADGFKLDDILPKNATEENKETILSRYQEFLDDDVRFAAVLWAIVLPHARDITQEEFDNGLRGGANQRAIAAFHEAFTDFSTPRQKLILSGIKVLMEKQDKMIRTASERLNNEAAKIDDKELAISVNGEIDRLLSERAGSSAATSA